MKRAGLAFAALIALTAGALAKVAEPQAPDGAAIFARNCASCHDGVDGSRAPSPEILKRRSPEAILSALTAGGMRPQGGRLSGAERRAVAEHLSGRALGSDITGARIGRCTASPPLSDPASSPAWRGWSPSVTNTRFQSAQQAGLTAEQVPKLSLKWAFGFPDATSAWSQPTIAGGRVFVGSQNGTVYALDAKSGCIYWTFTAKSGVRTALAFGPREGANGYAVYFGDTGANVYALDAATGRELWSRRLDEHLYARITGSPTLYQDRLYVPVSSMEETAASQPGYECCTFRGSLNALDVKTGAIVWQTLMAPPAQSAGKNAAGVALWGPSGVGIWSAPTIDVKRGPRLRRHRQHLQRARAADRRRDRRVRSEERRDQWIKQLTAGDVFGCRVGSANCGEKAGPDFDLGTPPMLVTLAGGRDIIVAAQKSGNAFAIDPDKEGALLWQYHAGEGSIWGGIQWGAAVDGERAYFPVSDIRTPKPGGLHAVGLTTGERAWYVPPPPLKCATGTGCSAALISAPTLIPGVLFSGSNDGALRALDEGRFDHLGVRHEPRVRDAQRRPRGRRSDPGPRADHRRRHALSQFRLRRSSRRPGNVLLAFEVQ